MAPEPATSWFEVRPVILPNGEARLQRSKDGAPPRSRSTTTRSWTFTTGWQHTVHSAPIPPLRTGWAGRSPGCLVSRAGLSIRLPRSALATAGSSGLLAAGVIVATQVTADRQERPALTRQEAPQREFWPSSGAEDADVHSAH